MRIISNVDSVKKKEPTLLAVLESIAVCSLSIWTSWRYGTIWHLVLAVAIAPFLLLRTKVSEDVALRLAATVFAGRYQKNVPRQMNRFWRYVEITIYRGT